MKSRGNPAFLYGFVSTFCWKFIKCVSILTFFVNGYDLLLCQGGRNEK